MQIVLTKEMIYAAGQDAANRNMRKNGREAWNEDDWNLACQDADKLWSKLPIDEKEN